MASSSRFKRLVTILMLQLLCSTNRSHAQIDNVLADSLQARLEQVCLSHGVMGISAAVNIPGKGLWKGATGYSSGFTPIDTNMLFNIGSITKSFMAAEILKLEEEGLLDIDDSIKSYLPYHTGIDSNITIRQLLNHTSGVGEILGSAWQTAMFADLTRMWGIQETIDSFLPAPAFNPGATWSYCNTNYMLLGLIIEHLRADSLTHVLRNDLINPLHLTETFMDVMEPFSNPVPHNWSNPNMVPGMGTNVSSYPREAMASSTFPAGGLYASAGDLAMWGHKLYTDQVISHASVSDMTNFINLSGSYYNGYGLGCMRFRFNNRTYYGHGGNFFGFAASMLFYPQDSITLTMLINEDCISPRFAAELFNTLINTIKLSTTMTSAGNDGITIYPNPANDKVTLNVNTPLAGETMVTVYSISGEKVYTGNMSNRSVDIPVSNFPNGIYYCEIKSVAGVTTKKMTVSH